MTASKSGHTRAAGRCIWQLADAFYQTVHHDRLGTTSGCFAGLPSCASQLSSALQHGHADLAVSPSSCSAQKSGHAELVVRPRTSQAYKVAMLD